MSEAANKSAEAHVPGRGRIYDSITETIGDTPLVRIKRLAAENGAKADVLLKLEFFNPIASVKDRIGVNMIEDLESRGVLKPGKSVIVEATSIVDKSAGSISRACPRRHDDSRNSGAHCGSSAMAVTSSPGPPEMACT